jgi:ribosomal protein L37E
MGETRLTPDLDLDGISPDKAFAVLGNDIRLDIVRVLWQANAIRRFDEVSDTAETMSFSDLRHEVEIDDNGQFNYHLSQLTPHFVQQTDDGYRLSAAGKQIARTVIAVSGTDDLNFSADLEQPCPLCNAPMTASYEDQWLRVRCTECDGQFGDETPHGSVFLSNYPAAAMAARTADEALTVGFYRCMLDNAYFMHGICRDCAGSIATSVSVCSAHQTQTENPCPECGTHSQVWATQRCEICGFAKRLPVEVFVMGLTPVIGFLDEQGIDVLAPSLEEIVGLLQHRVETTISERPFRVTVSIAGKRGTLDVSLDDELSVTSLDRPRPN